MALGGGDTDVIQRMEERNRPAPPQQLPRVYVKKSGIPKAGRGLFTRDFIAKNKWICEYGGDLQHASSFPGGRFPKSAKGNTHTRGVEPIPVYRIVRPRLFALFTHKRKKEIFCGCGGHFTGITWDNQGGIAFL